MSTSKISFKEDDIRPDRLMVSQTECYENDIRRLLERKDSFVLVPCPACGAKEYHEAFQKYQFNYVVCDSCQTMYTNPRPGPEILDWYYKNSENYAYWNKYIFPASEGTRREKIFRPRAERVLEICKRYNLKSKTLLEVGAGFGIFCDEIRKYGIFERIVAVEPTPDLAQTCRNRNLEVIENNVEDVVLDQGIVDVVVSFEVIEHLFSPRDFIKQCARLLSPGGLLILTCPNVKGFDVMLLQALSSAVDTEHLNYFHPLSLSNLVKACGFDTLEVQTPGKLDAELVRKKVLAGEFNLDDQPFLKRILMDEWERVGGAFQNFLAENNLSSHMWLVARKRQ